MVDLPGQLLLRIDAQGMDLEVLEGFFTIARERDRLRLLDLDGVFVRPPLEGDGHGE